MDKYRNETFVREELKEAVEKAGGLRAFARQHNLDPGGLSWMLQGAKCISDKVARTVGWSLVTEYRMLPPGPGEPPKPPKDNPIA